MKTEHKVLIFVYYFCIIIIMMLLFTFIFNNIIYRLFGDNSYKTNHYHIKIFGIWLILVLIMLYIKYNTNKYSKKKLTQYIKIHSDDNKEYDTLYKEIDEIGKFDVIIIIGFIIIFLNSYQHNFKENLKLFNEDLSILSETL